MKNHVVISHVSANSRVSHASLQVVSRAVRHQDRSHRDRNQERVSLPLIVTETMIEPVGVKNPNKVNGMHKAS